MKLKVVFDCMVFLQGAARPAGPAAACLKLAEEGHVELVVTDDILNEVRDVLSRPKVRKKFHSLTDATASAFIDQVRQFATSLPPVPHHVSLPRDPKDEKYLDLAAAAHAEFLVSRDNDLLSLADPSNPEGDEVRKLLPAIKIVDPASFLREMAQRTSNDAGP